MYVCMYVFVLCVRVCVRLDTTLTENARTTLIEKISRSGRNSDREISVKFTVELGRSQRLLLSKLLRYHPHPCLHHTHTPQRREMFVYVYVNMCMLFLTILYLAARERPTCSVRRRSGYATVCCVCACVCGKMCVGYMCV